MQGSGVHRRDGRAVACGEGEGLGIDCALFDEHVREGEAGGRSGEQCVDGQRHGFPACQGLTLCGLVVGCADEALTGCGIIIRVAQCTAQEQQVGLFGDGVIGGVRRLAGTMGQSVLIEPADVGFRPIGQVGEGSGVGLGGHPIGCAVQAHQHDRGFGAGEVLTQCISGFGALEQAQSTQQVGIALLVGRRCHGWGGKQAGGQCRSNQTGFDHNDCPPLG